MARQPRKSEKHFDLSEIEAEMRAGLRDRLRKCAEMAGSGEALSQKAAIPRRTMETYLSGAAEPKVLRLVRIARAACVSIGWLAAGEGEMRAGELPEAPKPHKAEALQFDPELLVDVVSGVEEGLVDAGATMDPEKKGQLLVAIYQLYSDSGAAPDKETILRLVRSAA